MSYDELWKIIDDSLKDLRRFDEAIPPEVMKDLHSAKTLIHIFEADPSSLETLTNIEAYLTNVEAYVVYRAHNRLGSKYVEGLMGKIKKVRENLQKKDKVGKGTTSKFVAGLPRGKPWIRVQTSNEIPREEIESLAEKDGLSFKMQQDGYLLIYGDKEKLKVFTRKVAEKLKRTES